MYVQRFEKRKVLMKKLLSIIGVIAALMILGGGAIAYHLYQKQLNLEKQLSGVMLAADDFSAREIREVEQIVEKITDPWSELQKKLSDTVVQVFALVAEFNWLEPYKTPNQGKGSGTGFFIDEEGYIITNAHVVNQAKAIFIQIPSLGKEQFECEIVCFVPDRDLSLIKIKDKDLSRLKDIVGQIAYLKLGNSDKLKRGAEVMTLGFPLGQQGLKSTTGVVSGRESVSGRQYIQIDAPINPGNSGGPCINGRGEVVGINTAKIMEAENVGYIIPVNELKLVLRDMYVSKNKLMRRPFLGVFYNSSTPAMSEYLKNPQSGGVYVTDTFKGGLLEKAGIKPGDMIYSINGHKVDMYGDISASWCEDKIALTDYVAFLPLGENIKLLVFRNGKQKEINVTFEQTKLPPIRLKFPDYEPIDYEVFGGMVVTEFARNLLPLLLQSAPELIMYEDPKNQLEPFLIVTNVLPNSQANRARVLRPGTRIAEVNGKEVKTLQEFREALISSLDTKYLTIKTKQDIFTVCEIEKILSEELDLSTTYRYTISPFIQKMMKKYLEEHEKKTGPNSAAAVAAPQ